MSTPEPLNPYDSPETVRPVGMSTSSKVLLGIGIGCGVLALLCCGGLGVTAFFFGRSFQKGMSDDPATIRAVSENIVEIDVPPPLKPLFSFDWTVPIIDRKMMTMVVYGHNQQGEVSDDEPPDSGLVLFQMDEEFANRDMLKTQFEAQLQQSGREDWDEVRLEESEVIEREINGSMAQFEFGKGQRRESEREVWQAIGSFDGKGGPAILFMQLAPKPSPKSKPEP